MLLVKGGLPPHVATGRRAWTAISECTASATDARPTRRKRYEQTRGDAPQAHLSRTSPRAEALQSRHSQAGGRANKESKFVVCEGQISVPSLW